MASLTSWEGPIPVFPTALHSPGSQRPTWANDEALKVLFEHVARYNGVGQWYIRREKFGFAVVLLGHPDGKRRYVVANEFLYGEESPRSPDPDFRTSALAIATERVDLLCRKQNDYGPLNIASMGYAGLLVRMNDKMERLKHLAMSGKEPDNEAVSDTLADLANYALIWEMGKRGAWPVPFEPVVLRRGEA